MTYGETISVSTQGFSEIVDITDQVERVISASGVREGLIAITVIGSTASVSTIEFEPALKQDMEELLNRLIPETIPSRHSETWGDDNGFSHMRATLMGPGVTLPVSNGRLLTGTWQQVVVIDHDNRPRTRQVRVQIVGD